MTIAPESIMPCFIRCHNIITPQKGFKIHKMQLKKRQGLHTMLMPEPLQSRIFYAIHLPMHKHYPALMSNREVLTDMF